MENQKIGLSFEAGKHGVYTYDALTGEERFTPASEYAPKEPRTRLAPQGEIAETEDAEARGNGVPTVVSADLLVRKSVPALLAQSMKTGKWRLGQDG